MYSSLHFLMFFLILLQMYFLWHSYDCVCQGVNKQQILQDRVYSVDMLLKPNFLLFKLISHLVSTMDMYSYFPIIKKPKCHRYFNATGRLCETYVVAPFGLCSLPFLV